MRRFEEPAVFEAICVKALGQNANELEQTDAAFFFHFSKCGFFGIFACFDFALGQIPMPEPVNHQDFTFGILNETTRRFDRFGSREQRAKGRFRGI